MTDIVPAKPSEVTPEDIDDIISRAIIIDGWRGEIRPGTPLKHIELAIQALLAFHERVGFVIGDVLNQAEEMYHELFAQIADATGYKPGTLKNMAYVARNVAPAQRKDGISPSMYYEIAKIKTPEKQDEWIERIKSEDLKRDEVREQMQLEEEAAHREKKGLPEIKWATCHNCGSTVPEHRLGGNY